MAARENARRLRQKRQTEHVNAMYEAWLALGYVDDFYWWSGLSRD